MKNILVLFLFPLLLLQCSQREQSMSSEKSMGNYATTESYTAETEEASESDSYEENSAAEPGSKIIKQGALEFEVEDLKTAKTRVDSLIATLDAYYESEQFNAYYGRSAYSLLIRVPNEQFDALIQELEQGAGELRAKNIFAEDVTEEYVDLSIRLDNNLAYLKQYNELLKKANSIAEILEVQEKIRQLEEEIESKKGRLQFLDNRVSFSTIRIELVEPGGISSDPGFFSRIGDAFGEGFSLFLNFLVVMVNLWCFWLLGLLLWFFRGNIARLFRRKA